MGMGYLSDPGAQCTRAALGVWRPNSSIREGRAPSRPFTPQNTQKPLRGTLKPLNSPSIPNTLRVFSDGLRPFCVFGGKKHPAPPPAG